MSRGLGAVQRRLIALVEGQPGRLWTVETLAEEVYPGEDATPARREAVRRALAKLDGVLTINRCRTGHLGSGGWHHTLSA